MELRLLFYSFIFLLGFGSVFNHDAHQASSACTVKDRAEQQRAVYIDHADLVDLIDEGFLCMDEEDTSDGNEDDNDGGKVFDQDNSIQAGSQMSLPAPLQPVREYADCSPLSRKTAPLYLLHRVFRI